MFPLDKLSSSTLHTIIFGFMLNKPILDRNFSSSELFNFISPPSLSWFNLSFKILISFSVKLFFLTFSNFFGVFLNKDPLMKYQ